MFFRSFARVSARSSAARRVFIGVFAVVAVLTAWTDRASAATTTWNTTFSGTINTGDTLELISPGSINGGVVNSGTLQFNLLSTPLLTVSDTISGSGKVLFTGSGTVEFSGGNTYLGGTTIRFGTLVLGSGGGVNHASADLVVGEVSGDVGMLEITGGSASSNNGYLGNDAGSLGTAVVSSGSWVLAQDLYVGRSGTGTLTLSGGSITSDNGFVGQTATGVGTAFVSSGTWAMSQDLFIGDSGTGALTLSGGGITSANGYLGATATGSGTAVVSSGSWGIAEALFIGNSGTGTLTLSGGLVTSGSSVFLGHNANSAGSLTVTSGTLDVGAILQVGVGGVGVMTINGGTVKSAAGYIGVNTTSSGTVTVTSGSWFTTGDLLVGFYDGPGTLDISSAGKVIVNGTLYRGDTQGQINLGAGGTLQIGTGTTSGLLDSDLVNDGTVIFNRSDDSTYGFNARSMSGSGTVTKQGAGRLTFSTANSYTGGTTIEGGVIDVVTGGAISHAGASVVVGTVGGGVGGLDVSGGSVTASALDVIRGTVNITSEGSLTTGSATLQTGTASLVAGTWSITNDLFVGAGGTATLAVSGGALTNQNTTIGVNLGDVGVATVTGGVWTNQGDLTVGAAGTGTLTVASTGLVIVNGTLSTGASGTVGVNAGGTLQIGSGSTSGILATSLANSGTVIFNRSDASAYAMTMTGTGDVRKQGAGALTITGSNSYSGVTTVEAGTLFVNGQLGNTAVVVDPTAVLGGEGTILGTVTANTLAVIAPGATANDIATLTVGGLDLTAGPLVQFTVSGTVAGVDYDQIAGVGAAPALQYGGELQIAFSGDYADGTTFYLFSDFTSRSSNFSQLTLSGSSSFTNSFAQDENGVWFTAWNGNNQRLKFDAATGNLVVVPEPSALMLAAGGIGLAGGWRWRRRRRS